ncbi:MAG TPA: glycosyltransferase family 87 protein [Acidimicrobiales bacterium]|jgi:MYXO-CTERM domain-containing protein|nr:glycosyltransferase family 87 protein [Acidimicrobiales bacterium]
MSPVVPSIVAPDRRPKLWGRDAGLSRTSREAFRRAALVMRRWSPEWRDSFLYSVSACFAGVTALIAGIPLYRQWGEMAVGPYAAAGVFMAVIAWRVGRSKSTSKSGPAGPVTGNGNGKVPSAELRPDPLGGRSAGRPRRWQAARVGTVIFVLAGATIVPLTMEVIWRSEGDAAAHVQPEVLVVEQAGVLADSGKDPYRLIDKDGHIVIPQSQIPEYELYYPYLPGMVLFGFASGSKVEARLSDARIQFLVFTVIIAVIALSRLRPPTDARFRALQVLTVLPTAALPLATGGDDMPVAALMLLGLVALQRRRPLIAGLALGAASSLKFTAWPLAVLAIWVALDLQQRRAIGRYLLGLLVVVCPVVLPVALSNPSAFIDNVIRFPLGLAGVASPAVSPLPGHLFVSAFPAAHRAYVAILVVGGLALLARHLMRRPPVGAAGVARLAGWVMLFAILLAPATRVGYLLYPINLFVWSWMLGRSADPAIPADKTGVHGPGLGVDRVEPQPVL